ncbi:molybdate ABC transporter permease subunit [Cellvibrio sp. PSBB023]|jgi:molybdate transport system permease protein|uniref:molybdate ABC transporter permease subunit n=1 Tax=Cellvibrio sp. PSBB023 TaxID=1945512 RepID=UPI00098ED261|nr:molybdate ABC transporter permease subunit [Cellvibrio sp. PSBB023]AQT60819.1 molybdate ABC transporter permease [Cellvibrio sp. PSBB023]
MLTDAEWEVLLLSAQVGLCATLLCLMPGVFFGWLLARKDFFAKPALEAVLFMPMVLPPTVPGYLLLVTFGSQGAVGQWLKTHFNIEFAFNWKGAVLAAAVIAFPLMVQAAKLSVHMIDRRLEQAASTLGSSPFKVWFTVTLPLMLPGILIGALMVFSRSLGEFGATITFVGNIAGETRTLPLAIYSATHQIGGDAIAARLIVICLALAFFSLLLSNILTRRTERWLGVRRA